MHTGIEKGIDAALDDYYMSYPIITDEHINEAIKLENMIPRARLLLPEGGRFEQLILASDFIGYADYVVDGELYDFKYSNHGDRYKESLQLHLYSYFCETTGMNKIQRMYYLMIPKVGTKQKTGEDLSRFRQRISAELAKVQPYIIEVGFDYKNVIKYYSVIKKILETDSFEKRGSYLCNWCEYHSYCEKGEDYMILPKNERRNIDKVNKRTIWIYGAPFSGKTTFANKFPDPLILNTDGNTTFVDAPVLFIQDEKRVEGRIPKITLAWDKFKRAVEDLERKDNAFKTIIVDLLEDLYEYCRLYIYARESIQHETDSGFGKGWDLVTTEFLSTVKRLMNLDYENIILISHEDMTKDITRKSGDKITAIKPNLRDKVANKVAGMVHIVARVIADGDVRTLSFKPSEVVFGGGRLTVEKNEIPLDADEFMKIFEEASENAASELSKKRGMAIQEQRIPATAENPTDEKPETRIHRRREARPPPENTGDEPNQQIATPEVEATEVEATETPGRRKRRERTDYNALPF